MSPVRSLLPFLECGAAMELGVRFSGGCEWVPLVCTAALSCLHYPVRVSSAMSARAAWIWGGPYESKDQYPRLFLRPDQRGELGNVAAHGVYVYVYAYVCIYVRASLLIGCAALASSSGFTAGGLSYCREEREAGCARRGGESLGPETMRKKKSVQRVRCRSCRVRIDDGGVVWPESWGGAWACKHAKQLRDLSDRTGGWTQPHRIASRRPGYDQGQGPPPLVTLESWTAK
jgi:hypothetical protein